MPTNSTDYYESLMYKHVLGAILQNPKIKLGLNPDELTEVASLADIPGRQALSGPEFDAMIISSVSHLMRHYHKNTGVEPTIIEKILSGNNKMKEYVDDVWLSACCSLAPAMLQQERAFQLLANGNGISAQILRSSWNSYYLVIDTIKNILLGSELQTYIDNIKERLSDGVLDNEMEPGDNFPKMVKAICNKTQGLPGWKFKTDVLRKLDIMNLAVEADTPTSNTWGEFLMSPTAITAIGVFAAGALAASMKTGMNSEDEASFAEGPSSFVHGS